MPVITVVRPFIFAPADGVKLHYERGEYEVDDATAEHWFVRAHLEGYVEPPPAQGTTQYAQAMLNVEQAVRRAEPMAPSIQPRAPLPPDTIAVASRSGMVSEGAHYFAGAPQVDKPMPGHDETGPRISFVGA